MRLSKRVKRNIERGSLRIKAIYEAPNAELDKIVAELKEAAKNRAIQIIQEIIDTNEADAREKLKNFNKKDKL